MAKLNPNFLLDEQLIELSSRILQVSYFRLFEMAYEEWHGESLVEEQTEQFYTDYLFNRAFPLWLRHYSRQLCAMTEATSGLEKYIDTNTDKPLFDSAASKEHSLLSGFTFAMVYSQIKQRILGLFRF